MLKVHLGTLTASVSSWPLDKNKQTLVFIHGAGFHSGFWKPQIPLKQQFNLILLNLPGRLGADKSTASILSYAEQADRSLSELDMPAIVVGHSMGGAVVQQLLLMKASWISAAVLACTGARLKVAPVVNNLLMQGGTVFTQMFSQGSSLLTLEQISRLGAELAKTEIGLGDFLACNRFDLMAEITGIVQPCMVIVGDSDLLTPEKYSQFLGDNIPDSELVLVKDAGHLLPWEATERFNQLITEFALRHEPDPISTAN